MYCRSSGYWCTGSARRRRIDRADFRPLDLAGAPCNNSGSRRAPRLCAPTTLRCAASREHERGRAAKYGQIWRYRSVGILSALIAPHRAGRRLAQPRVVSVCGGSMTNLKEFLLTTMVPLFSRGRRSVDRSNVDQQRFGTSRP
jgi:hypothetical protein